MALRLTDALAHQALRAADPIVRASVSLSGQAWVRWVHSSEVLEIAPLLRGGELLLTGGLALARVRSRERRLYIAQLAERGIAALAVETGHELAELPADLVRAAEELGLPLIELRKVVPFVEVAQALNSELVSESVVNYQRADSVSHRMAVELAHGAGLDRLIRVIAAETGAAVDLLDRAGDAFESSGPAAPEDAALRIEIDVPLRGIVTTRLRLRAVGAQDLALVRTVGERAVGILALALLEHQSPTLHEVAGAELIRAVLADTRGWRLAQLCAAAGVDPRAPLVPVIGRTTGPASGLGAVEAVVRKRATHIVAYIDQDEILAFVILPSIRSRLVRRELVAGLSADTVDHSMAFTVGPLARDCGAAGDSVRAARLAHELAPMTAGWGSVLDAESVAVERLCTGLDPEASRALVDELLAEVLDHDAARGSRLTETLDAWLSYGCNTAETARFLHLERQSLHNRLQRIFELIGGDPRGTDRLAALHFATRLAKQSRDRPFHSID